MLTALVSLTMLALIGAGIACWCAVLSIKHAEIARSASRNLLSLSSAVAALEVQSNRNTETLRKLSGMVYKRKQEAEADPEIPAPLPREDRAAIKAKLREQLFANPRAK